MAAIDNPARAFVNLIIGEYDVNCYPETPSLSNIFDPELEHGLKENSLDAFSEELSKAGPKFNPVEFDGDIVRKYKQTAPTLSHLFALAGILDAPSKDPTRQKIQPRVIEALVQDHLRNKMLFQSYELDPMGSLMHEMNSSLAEWANQPKPLEQFSDGKRHFYAQIFQEVFRVCNEKDKREIIQQLENFQPVLNTRSAQLQRVIFKVEGTFNHYITNSNVKFGVCIALGIASFATVSKLIALAGQFFASPIFISFSTLVINRLPVVVIQITNGAYTRIVGLVVYVTSTRLYQYKIPLLQIRIAPLIICRIVPVMSWVYSPAQMVALHIGAFTYQRSFGPDARTQIAISESLNNYEPKVRKELLEGGMKAYQVWMYLMEQGPDKGVFI